MIHRLLAAVDRSIAAAQQRIIREVADPFGPPVLYRDTGRPWHGRHLADVRLAER